jgi:ubiquinone/menaquinone biosynthesis C-methylase UbiE
MKSKSLPSQPILQKQFDYFKETRLAYRDSIKAKRYKEQQTRGLSWARFTMMRERLCVEAALRDCNLTRNDRILDVPCGTGILADVLSKRPVNTVAVDISREMMEFARREYRGKNFNGFIQADITKLPFYDEIFDCAIILGFMHRVPESIRLQTLREVVSISKRFIILSYSIDSPAQRVKMELIKKLFPTHKSALFPISLKNINREFSSLGLTVKKNFKVLYFLSSESIFLLEKI